MQRRRAQGLATIWCGGAEPDAMVKQEACHLVRSRSTAPTRRGRNRMRGHGAAHAGWLGWGGGRAARCRISWQRAQQRPPQGHLRVGRLRGRAWTACADHHQRQSHPSKPPPSRPTRATRAFDCTQSRTIDTIPPTGRGFAARVWPVPHKPSLST